ncbi:MAG TPA: hypothetical protein PLF50_05595 [Candidatus Cloacimonadota bacterium]|nr:hypothetical protein [Candidatus Cloacimonadota bacterium]
MKSKRYLVSPQYFIAIMYVSIIVFLTSAGLIYSCFAHNSYVYLAVGIIGVVLGVMGIIEWLSKKQIFPRYGCHWLREIIALIGLALAVYILRYGSLSCTLNWREKMVCILLFVIGVHGLHLRGYLTEEVKEEKKE